MLKNTLLFFLSCLGLLISCKSGNKYADQAANNGVENKDFEATINFINEKSKTSQLKFDDYKLRALSFVSLKNYQLAINDFRHCLSLKSKDTVVINKIATSYALLSKPDSAILFYSILISMDDKNWEAYNNRGLSYLNINKFQPAMSDFTKSLRLNPNYYMSLNNMGLLNERISNYSEAIKYYTISLSKYKKNDRVYFNRAVSYMYMKQPEHALFDFDKAIELNSHESLYYLNRGMANYLLKKRNASCEDWGISVKMGNKEALQYKLQFCN
ncbi:MAG: tetratricopeptide repeat protein [Bacteroidota bacterium]